MDRKNGSAVVLAFVLIIGVLTLLLFAVAFNRSHSTEPDQSQAGTARRDEWPAPTTAPAPAPTESSIHLAMGNPSGASADRAQPDNYLMRKPYFALSYNNSHGTPNWVSWCLVQSDFGSAPRTEFSPDSALPPSFKHVVSKDYTGTGFDRGHMCPHNNRASSVEASTATFALTNVVPQAPANNHLAWADLEDYCRELVTRKHQTLYIVAGPHGQGGEGSKGLADTIAHGKITVPAQCWKVILVLNHGTGTASDIDRVTSATRLIAVVMPNSQSVDLGWAKYRTSVEELENLTGYRFFDRVPDKVIGPLKKETDRQLIPPVKPHRYGGISAN
jgi:endonuclease G